MDLRERVTHRVSDYKTKLELVNMAIAEEMNMAHDQRHINLLHLLYLEREVHSQTIDELEAILQDSVRQREENTFPAVSRERITDPVKPAENGKSRPHIARRTCRILTYGGIGDGLLLTPALRMLKRQYPDRRIHVYCQTKSHKEALMNNRYIDRLVVVGTLKMIIYHLLNQFHLMKIHKTNYNRLTPSLFYRTSAAKIIGEMLGLRIDDTRPDCFLTEEEERVAKKTVAEYSAPVAIHVTPNCSPNKQWPTENWEALVLNNPQYSFLQLGSAADELIRGAIDLRGTSLREAFGIVKEVLGFVGVDSVFAHAAAAFQTPAVTLFGASTPAIWGHPTSKNLYHPPRCSPCLEVLGRDPCPHGRTCMSSITVSDVELALSSLIEPPNGESDLRGIRRENTLALGMGS